MNAVMLWTGSSPSTLSTTAPKATALIRLLPADFPSFNGDIEEQESYKTKAEAQFGQTVFKFLLTQDAAIHDEKEREKKLFNVFKNLFHGEKAYSIINQSLKDEHGNVLPQSRWKVWQDFEKWCNLGGRKKYPHQNHKEQTRCSKIR
eukprot:4411359-Ditylum_brightwellii.AAC.1